MTKQLLLKYEKKTNEKMKDTFKNADKIIK